MATRRSFIKSTSLFTAGTLIKPSIFEQDKKEYIGLQLYTVRGANKAGMKYFFVEQDKTSGDPFASITKSIAYITKNLL